MHEIFFEVYSGKPVLSDIAVLYISLSLHFFPLLELDTTQIITIPLTSKLWEEEERRGWGKGELWYNHYGVGLLVLYPPSPLPCVVSMSICP